MKGAPAFIFFVFRILLGGAFVFSGWEKLMAPIENFIAVILQYQFFPAALVPILAFVVPWLELIFGTFAFLGFMTRVSMAALCAFLASFIVLLGRSLWLKLLVTECGCFGSALPLTPIQAVVLDGGLLLMALALVFRRSTPFAFDQWLQR